MTTFAVETIEPQMAAAIRAEVPMDQLPAVFDRGFPAIIEAIGAQGVAPAGPPFGYYPRMPGDTVEVVVGFPVTGPITAAGDVVPFELPGGRVVTGTHVGPYESLSATYDELIAWSRGEGLTLGGVMWEIYTSDPSAEPDPATWRTNLVWPLA